MTKQEFASRLQNACAAVTAAEQELTEIDSRFGDADHGLTMSKIAKAISAAAGESEGGIQAMLDDADKILFFLEKRNGTMPYSDDTPPAIIKSVFDISKSAFKRALGRLMKEGKVVQEDGWTSLKK